MKRVMCEAELHRLALRTGAEVEFDSRLFNSDRAKVKLAPPPEPKPVTSAPINVAQLPEYMTREQVELLLEKLEDRLVQRMDKLFEHAPSPEAPPTSAATIDVEVHRDEGYGYQPIRRLTIKRKADK